MSRASKISSGLLALAFLGVIGDDGLFGSRRIERVHSFQYQGQYAKLLKNNRRFAADLYWVEVNGDSIVNARLTSDDHREIVHVEERGYSIEDLDSISE